MFPSTHNTPSHYTSLNPFLEASSNAPHFLSFFYPPFSSPLHYPLSPLPFLSTLCYSTSLVCHFEGVFRSSWVESFPPGDVLGEVSRDFPPPEGECFPPVGEGINDGRRAFFSGAGLVGLAAPGGDLEGGVSTDSICDGDSLPVDPCSLPPPPPTATERGPLPLIEAVPVPARVPVALPAPVAGSLARKVLLLRVSFCWSMAAVKEATKSF